MASYSKRIYKSWRVSVVLQSHLGKAFDALDQAQAYGSNSTPQATRTRGSGPTSPQAGKRESAANWPLS